MRAYPLLNLKQGINRLRVKGGANPSSLYDLLNAYITTTGTIKPREGTIRAQSLNPITKGLMASDGVFNVFSNTLESVPVGYVCNVLIDPNDSSQFIDTIWYAKPFMGFPYVVAEFSDGDVFHYWLQNSGTWAPNTVYQTGNLILPKTTPTGLAYLATRVSAVNPTWQPETNVSLNDIVEPTEYTGYQYKAVAVAGATPHTSSTEPVWPTVSAGTIQEFGDFDTSATDAGTTQGSGTAQAAPLPTTLTDRYGDSSTIANAGTPTGSSFVPPTTASTKVTVWAKGTLYAPGAVVQPTTTQGAFLNAIPNGDFENGNDGSWILTSGTTYNTVNEYQGNECLQFEANNNNQTATMNTYGVVTPGQSVTASVYVNPNNAGANLSMGISLRWYDAGDTFISSVNGPINQGGGYRLTSVTGTAPQNAAHVRVQLFGGNGGSGNRIGYADLVSWNLATPAPVSNFLYEAVQATAGTSASTEPTWPTTEGDTVIDGGVTWEAIGTSIITWEAIPIMLSGATEPAWPTSVPIAVLDPSTFNDSNGNPIVTSISWVANTRQVTDINCPDTTGVVSGASHVFAVDKDIVGYSAAVNPTDWTSANNAGYLPTGLNNYGDNPAKVLALYRSNLMALNAGGYQMWQIDPDPANMALLDAQPVGSVWTRAAQSVSNDLLFLTEVGVRNLGTVGATANMQVGNSGQPVDPLVVASMQGMTELLLHFEGAPGSTALTDFSPWGNVLTPIGTPGAAVLSAAEAKFGNTSALFTGSAGWTVPIVSGGLLDLGSGDFTLEFWIYPVTGGGTTQEVLVSSDGVFACYYLTGTQQLNMGFNGGPGGSVVLTPNAWNAVAFVLQTDPLTELSMVLSYLNGVDQGGEASAGRVPLSGLLGIGYNVAQGGAFPFNGYIDELRITRSARYTQGGNIARQAFNYTPATQSFPRSDPLSVYYPGRGQYWLIFENLAYVFTVNGQGLRTWSRYIFPDQITDWTLNGGTLYLRTAGNLVWQLDAQTLVDDYGPNAGNIQFLSVAQTPYVDVGPLGINKNMIGIDLVGTGVVTIQIGWAQNDSTTFSDDINYLYSNNVTPNYVLDAADTVPGQPLPFPIQAPSFTLILTFEGNQAWEWQASNLYLQDMSGGGATG